MSKRFTHIVDSSKLETKIQPENAYQVVKALNESAKANGDDFNYAVSRLDAHGYVNIEVRDEDGFYLGVL